MPEAEAIMYLKKVADPVQFHNLGAKAAAWVKLALYYYSKETIKGHAQAFKYLTWAASDQQINNPQARAVALYLLGCCHLFGEGTKKDEDKAFKLFTLIANDPYAIGQPCLIAEVYLRLAYFHYLGYVSEKNYDEAFRLLTLVDVDTLNDPGNEWTKTEACLRLGDCHYNGHGTMSETLKKRSIIFSSSC